MNTCVNFFSVKYLKTGLANAFTLSYPFPYIVVHAFNQALRGRQLYLSLKPLAVREFSDQETPKTEIQRVLFKGRGGGLTASLEIGKNTHFLEGLSFTCFIEPLSHHKSLTSHPNIYLSVPLLYAVDLKSNKGSEPFRIFYIFSWYPPNSPQSPSPKLTTNAAQGGEM